jgi:predicted transcriptional regulator
MIELKFNPGVVTRLKEAGFYPDTMVASFLVMKALKDGDLKTLDALDDNNTSRRMIILYIELERRGFIERSSEVTNYTLTEKGMTLLMELDNLAIGKYKDDTDQWIDEWIHLFPKGVRSGGKLLRSDAKSCLTKMRKFRKDYGYDKDIIFKATRAYLQGKERDNWEKTKCAVYMIHKVNEGSMLAEECARLLDTEPVSPHSQIISSNMTGLV